MLHTWQHVGRISAASSDISASGSRRVFAAEVGLRRVAANPTYTEGPFGANVVTPISQGLRNITESVLNAVGNADSRDANNAGALHEETQDVRNACRLPDQMIRWRSCPSLELTPRLFRRTGVILPAYGDSSPRSGTHNSKAKESPTPGRPRRVAPRVGVRTQAGWSRRRSLNSPIIVNGVAQLGP